MINPIKNPSKSPFAKGDFKILLLENGEGKISAEEVKSLTAETDFDAGRLFGWALTAERLRGNRHIVRLTNTKGRENGKRKNRRC